MKEKGFAPIVVLIIAVLILGGGYYLSTSKRLVFNSTNKGFLNNNDVSQPTPEASVNIKR